VEQVRFKSGMEERGRNGRERLVDVTDAIITKPNSHLLSMF